MVQVKRGNRWVTLKKHPTHARVKVPVAALNINVHKKGYNEHRQL